MVYYRERLRRNHQLMGRRVPPHRLFAFFRPEDADVDKVTDPSAMLELEKEGLWAKPVDLDAVGEKTKRVVCFEQITRHTKCCGLHVCSGYLIMMQEASGTVPCPECRMIW
jgi:hypothetical protein